VNKLNVQSPTEPAKSIRIVLVDDHQILREGLMCRLQKEPDFEVVGVAASSKEAYSCVEKMAPNLVIMDLHRPGENGLITTGRIRRAHPQIKILILTGDTSLTAPRDVLVAGAHGFIRKADPSDILVGAVRTVIAGEVFLRPNATTMTAEKPSVGSVALRESTLTKREFCMLKRLADGLSYKEIAGQLHVSVKSIEYYRAGLVKKTGCATRAELVRYAVRMGIVTA
jgi:DNA-binding NarL/FixJ family response regulator